MYSHGRPRGSGCELDSRIPEKFAHPIISIRSLSGEAGSGGAQPFDQALEPDGRGGSIFHHQLRQDAGDMVLHGRGADPQNDRDFAVGLALDQPVPFGVQRATREFP